MPNPKQFRRTFIREWRQHRELTLEQLAARIGHMVPSNLSMLERGQRGYTQETLERIAVALQTDVATLLTRQPGDPADELQKVLETAKPGQRRQIVEIAKIITKPDSGKCVFCMVC